MKRFGIYFWLLFVLLCIFSLRLPSFFEPYWYGDEGIYLVLGQMMQRGAVLYRDIWDNKPPLLYLIYAIHPTLLWAKITATLFVLGTCTGVYYFSRRLSLSPLFSLLSSLLCGILLSLPLLEGTIANAELYFTLPIILAAYLIYKRIPTPTPSPLFPLLIGFLLTAAFFLKVPAVFDFIGMFFAVLVIRGGLVETRPPLEKLRVIFSYISHFLLPIFVPFVISFFFLLSYFLYHHALSDSLIAAFSQNSSYVAVASGPLSKLSNPLFIKGLILALFSLLSALLYFRKQISKELLLLALWFGFSLYGALLSGRPYMHYLLQIVPPAVILTTYLLINIRKCFAFLIILSSIFYLISYMFRGSFSLDTVGYYQNWFDYVSERKSWADYVNSFDSRTLNSYTVADYLKANTNPNDPIFVWGDAAFIYVLSERPAATKFIQAHHLTTINPQNYQSIVARLEKFQPKYILISRPVHFPFPTLENLVKKNYRFVNRGQDLYIYQNILPVTPPPWNPHYY